MPSRDAKLTIYHDAQCPFCQWAAQTARRYDTRASLEFRDFHLQGAETPFAISELNRAMHVRSSDGAWRVGFFGWIEILKALPRWRWLARLASLPPLRWIGQWLYRMIASNRYRIPNFVLRWLGAPVCDAACELPPTRS